ncbi:MAG: hypothetical protein U0165_14120 [Polyangiaceae bacterium]
MSDGRLDTPSSEQAAAFAGVVGAKDVPVHTVAVAEREPET